MNLGTDPLSRQLKLVKNLCDAYIFLNADNIKPFISRDYKFHTFPKIADLQDEAKERHLERYAVFSSLMTKIKVTVRDEVEVLRKVTLAVGAVLHTTDGDKLEYESTLMFTIVEEDGELKVAKLEDFTSSGRVRGKLHSLVTEALAKQA